MQDSPCLITCWFVFCRSRVSAAEWFGGLFPGDQLRPGSAHPVLSEGAT